MRDARCVIRKRAAAILLTLCTLATAACSSDQRYPLTGQVVAVDAERQELTVKHEDIRGFMPGMTMPFKVKDAQQVAASRPGDLITATLVVEASAGYLEDVRKTGEAPLPADLPKGPPARMIEPGAEVPAATFVDESGQERRLADFRGKTVAVTFIYTRCPVPDFCPLMDRHFAAVQNALKADPALASRTHLLSVSFDPDFDTPKVLKAHAARVGADPSLWSYVTGTREGIDAFAAAFGVSIMREDGTMEEIIHNLRTAVIGADGTLVEVFNGNDWQPGQLVASIRAADARR
jgi:protein SCO1/2